MPVFVRTNSSWACEREEMGDALPLLKDGVFSVFVLITSSTKLFHASQDGQRPSHFVDSCPQFWQRYMVLSFIFDDYVCFFRYNDVDLTYQRIIIPQTGLKNLLNFIIYI